MGGGPLVRIILEKSLRNRKKKSNTVNLGDLPDLKVRARVLLLDRTPISKPLWCGKLELSQLAFTRNFPDLAITSTDLVF